MFPGIKAFFALGLVISLFVLVPLSPAQNFVLEAEEGVFSGSNAVITHFPGFSGSGAVGEFRENGDRLDISLNLAKSSTYDLNIRALANYGYKEQDLFINDVFVSRLIFDASSQFTEYEQGTIYLEAGINTLSIRRVWGWMTIDVVQLTEVVNEPHDYGLVDENPIDPQITIAALDVYDFLRANYGTKVVAGQIQGFDTLSNITTQTPLIKGWDFQSYSSGYAYLWDTKIGGHTFGWFDSMVTEEIIEWFHETNGCGIATVQWHWHAPNGIGSSPGTNSFYTNQTTFDISQAIIPSHPHHQYVLLDIDYVAEQLSRLQDAGVPVLWRPLHEAGGGWFWWGAQGQDVCKQLWDLMYDRIVNHHGIHNCLWVWSTPEEDWYVGNGKCDILGYDSYPGAFNYTPQSIVFDSYYEMTEGRKLLAMTENGPIPSIDLMIDQDSMWSFFATWVDFVANENSPGHVQSTYLHPSVITLESKPKDPGLPGDINCDGAVNLLDVGAFVDLISNGEYLDKADLNQDGEVNLLDVGPFIDVLSGG